jgi:hypothetical protein
MNTKGTHFVFRFWEKLTGVIVTLCIVGLLLAVYLQVRYGDILFIEGILVFAAGAYVAAGVSNVKRETQATMITDPEGLREFLEEQRAAQVADGIRIMIVGAIIIAISIITFLV